MLPERPSVPARVVVYVTRPEAGAPDSVEVLVMDDPRSAASFLLPDTPLRAGEHPCEAADRLVAELLAPVTGGESVTFAYRKVQEKPDHVFVTEAAGPLPDRIGACRWVSVGSQTPWG